MKKWYDQVYKHDHESVEGMLGLKIKLKINYGTISALDFCGKLFQAKKYSYDKIADKLSLRNTLQKLMETKHKNLKTLSR